MSAILTEIFQLGFLAAVIRIATPFTFATLGEMISERCGVLNLGIEGIMLISAMSGFLGAYYSGNLWVGVLAAAATGALVAAVHAALTVLLGVSQHVCGIGITLLCTGLAYFTFRLAFRDAPSSPTIVSFAAVDVPVLSDIPVLGPVLFRQFALTYFAFAAVPTMALALYRTPWGLNLRMAGENPRAADSAGVSVMAVRFWAVTLGGALMGVAGAFLSMAQFNTFTFGVVSGRGWIAVALVVFGRWDPWRCAGAALLFAAVDALQLRLQAAGVGQVPYEAFLAMPFVVTILAMAFMSRDAVAPPALLRPFRKEER